MIQGSRLAADGQTTTGKLFEAATDRRLPFVPCARHRLDLRNANEGIGTMSKFECVFYIAVARVSDKVLVADQQYQGSLGKIFKWPL
jgi:hypothetical protein